MNLDDKAHLEAVDPGGMLKAIDGLPGQLDEAWEFGQRTPLGDISNISQVIVAGMGGSAIGADLLAAYCAPSATVPIIVWRDYDLPGFVVDDRTLLVASSHSGNTEETISAFQQGREVGAQRVAICTGGKLASLAEAEGVPLWKFEHDGQPRAAVGFSFGLLLAMLTRLGLIPDPEFELKEAVSAMLEQQEEIQANSQVVENPAKRMAGQLIGRWPVILGAGLVAPVARRWRTQIAELAKAVAQFEILPEADHNMLAGVMEPESLFDKIMAVFLDAPQEHERNRLRTQATCQILMVEGFNTDTVRARGESRLAQQWTLLHFGDYTAFYLAAAYGIDPTPVDAIEDLKRRLAA